MLRSGLMAAIILPLVKRLASIFIPTLHLDKKSILFWECCPTRTLVVFLPLCAITSEASTPYPCRSTTTIVPPHSSNWYPGGTLQPKRMIRSEEHTSELQSLMRISYAVFCLKKKKHKSIAHHTNAK